jgi:hypothetical protein
MTSGRNTAVFLRSSGHISCKPYPIDASWSGFDRIGRADDPGAALSGAGMETLLGRPVRGVERPFSNARGIGGSRIGYVSLPSRLACISFPANPGSGLVEADWYAHPVNLVLRRPAIGAAAIEAGKPVAQVVVTRREDRPTRIRRPRTRDSCTKSLLSGTLITPSIAEPIRQKPGVGQLGPLLIRNSLAASYPLPRFA